MFVLFFLVKRGRVSGCSKKVLSLFRFLNDTRNSVGPGFSSPSFFYLSLNRYEFISKGHSFITRNFSVRTKKSEPGLYLLQTNDSFRTVGVH